MRLHGPVDDVNVVDVLLDDVVAAQPSEVVPVAHLVLEVLPLLLARIGPQNALVPVTVPADDLADVAVVDTLHHLQVAALMPPLRAGDNADLLLLRRLVRLEHLPDAGAIDGDRFFGEDVDVLLRVDSGFEVDGTEPRGRGQDDVVQPGGVEHLLVGVQSDVGLPVEVHAVAALLDAVVLGGLIELADAALEAILERIAQGDDADAVGGFQHVDTGVGTAAAAADDADLDLVIPRRMYAAGHQGRSERSGGA